ncbi:MAG TPA: methyltransferase domain-containing protein [Acidimicrobiales bacterium]|nr:methyltransferase domain-containing protein [Acidimicrobiales bacterium]
MSDEAKKIAEVFDRSAPTYDSVIPFFATFGNRLVELADLAPGARVLDAGCGRGATLVPAARQVGPSGGVIGVDLSCEMLALLHAELECVVLGNVAAARMDLMSLAIPDASFDMVLTNFVLHLVPYPERAAAELARVLRPGGHCVASVPSGTGPDWDFVGRLFRAFADRCTEPPSLPYRPEFDLPTVLSSAGLSVLETRKEKTTFVFPDEAAWWQWAWTHGMRGFFEILPDDALEEMRLQVLDELAQLRTGAGVPMRQEATFVVAVKRAAPVGAA